MNIFRHYKGGKYILLFVAETHHHNGELDAVYVSMTTGKIVTRPLNRDSRNDDSWIDVIEWPDGIQRNRFTPDAPDLDKAFVCVRCKGDGYACMMCGAMNEPKVPCDKKTGVCIRCIDDGYPCIMCGANDSKVPCDNHLRTERKNMNFSSIESLNDQLVRAHGVFDHFHVQAGVDLPEEEVTLSWRKHHSEWRLVVLSSSDGSVTPLLNASLAIRILASRSLLKLYEACVDATRKQSEDVLQAILDIDQFIISKTP
jgi:hypothetical protein